ncbi:glycosyltransferase [Microbacterium ureisolvens]|uniref:glycosyltransferase n=1 Tax=Microbacterium ureisolvens TaxID=2781186 RepID=UPI0036321E96
MGVKQGLENVVEAARLADAQNVTVRFVLLGNGGQRERLRQLAGGVDRVQFIDPLPDDDYAAAIQSADVLLVNEKPGVSEMAVPSKLTSYFSAGKPVLAATDPAGITAGEIARADAGVVVPSGAPQTLLAAALDLGRDPIRASRLGANGLRYRRTVLDEDTALDKFTDILTCVIEEHSTRRSVKGRVRA